MSTRGETRIFPSYQQIITHLRTPIYRNGYFLMISSLATSGIGLLYWILAAHRYSTYMVGINSAIIAAMTFLAGVSELNLMSALMRFIPMAGRHTGRFVLLAYLASLVVAAVISYFFIRYLAFWSPALGFLKDNQVLSIWFILSTMLWCIFVLQDSVLTGLRQTSWVPVENTVFSLTKVALMLIFAVSIPALGIFASWTFALIVAVLPTNYYIFRKLIPAHQRKAEQASLSIESHQVARFAATDYLGALFWIIANTLMPVIVTSVSGATANAYFYLAWTIANTLYLIGPAMGSSLVVETAQDQQKLGLYSRRMYQNSMKIVIPAAILIVIGAPYILLIFGKGYSVAGTMALRLLALSAIPNVVNSIFVSVARAQRRVGDEVLTLGVLCTLLMGSSFVFLRLFGIVGVGIGWLGSQILVAIFVYGLKLMALWRDLDRQPDKMGFMRVFGQVQPSLLMASYRLARALNVFVTIQGARQKWSVHAKQARISPLLPLIMREISHGEYGTFENGWKLLNVASNHTNTIVAFLESNDGMGPVVLKIPSSSREAESLRKQSENLVTLAGNEELGEWRRVLPKLVACGSVKGHEYFAEHTLNGIPMYSLFHNHVISWSSVKTAAYQINMLHQKTARCVEVDEGLERAWVDEPLNILVQFSQREFVSSDFQLAINHLRHRLHEALYKRQVCVSWIHGDYSPANILFDSSGTSVSGIVDWDLARPNELPLIDLLHLLISIRMEIKKQEMGRVVSDLLVNRNWNPAELKLIQAVGQDLQGGAIDLQDLLLLTWLRHINANVTKTERFDNHKQWVEENFLSVLRVLAPAHPENVEIEDE